MISLQATLQYFLPENLCTCDVEAEVVFDVFVHPGIFQHLQSGFEI